MRWPFLVLILCGFLVSTGCSGGVSNLKWLPNPGIPQLEPYSGQVIVFWRSAGEPEALKNRTYYHLGRISGRSKWCGMTPPINNEELHAKLIEEAGRRGGNAIIMKCGYGGYYEGACYCYGEVIRFKE